MRTAKAWVAAVSSVVTALSAAFADDILSNSEVGGLVSTVVLAALGVYAVYKIPNRDVTEPTEPADSHEDPYGF